MSEPGDVVDWNLAVATGHRLVPAGPSVSEEEAAAVVRQLRRASERAVEPVAEVTGLTADFDEHRVEVVGRPEWIRANVGQFREAIQPLTGRLRESGKEPSALGRAIGSRVTAVQMGGVLAWLSAKVLGQFEAFGSSGRLLLVAPNIAQAERQLDVDPLDFRLWVCLHEETHRVQFGAVSWLSGHFTTEVHAYLEETDTDGMAERVLTVLRSSRGNGRGLVDLVQTPEQRAILDRLTALMSLLEGHADVVMDSVGPRIVPSVDIIRERFEQRRRQAGTIDGFFRRLIGLDAKLRQYTEGASFVRGVVDAVGMSGFNAVWSGPESLPSLEEISYPQAWVRRVHG